jgi:glycosyltransferase involved in cell wall biosynthesis
MNKISIITATYNAEACLANLIESLLKQEDIEFEFIVVDGGSKDGTVNIIKKYQKHINHWISERDNGIYDAWNKGLDMVSGDWIMFLGADDILVDGSLKKYTEFMKTEMVNNEVLFISSKKQMIDKKGKIIRTTGAPWNWPTYLEYMMVSHPGALHSKKLFEQYGNFNTDYKICGDYELLLRAKNNLVTAYMDEVTVKASEGGASDSIDAVWEHYKAVILVAKVPKYKALANAITIIIKFIGKKGLRKLGINLYIKGLLVDRKRN